MRVQMNTKHLYIGLHPRTLALSNNIEMMIFHKYTYLETQIDNTCKRQAETEEDE